MHNWRLGISVSNPSKDILKECSDVGFSCIEVIVKDFDYERAVQTAADAKAVCIDIWSLHLPFGTEWDISAIDEQERLAVVQKLFDVIELTSPLKAKVAVIHGSYEPIEPKDRDVKIQACIKSLKALVEKCREHGLQLAIECLPRTCLGNSSMEILAIVEAVKGLSVCFDTNHLTIEEPVDFVKKVGKYIITTHVSDYDKIDERHWLPGKGVNDWQGLLTGLKNTNYSGPILFEVASRQADQVITPIIVMENWQRLIKTLK
ncbi:MAG: sugar phosphate isomerase/epimerase [Firmicutes bacterium]|nr:sugar phosphate isomerase/epimerase [Bacillota bacterium]